MRQATFGLSRAKDTGYPDESRRVMFTRAAMILVSAVVLLSNGGCSPAKRDWERTQKANTIQAYRAYDVKYPGRHSAEVQTHVENLRWVAARCSSDSLKSYLAAYPQGLHADSARTLIEAAEWDSTEASKSPLRYLAFYRAHPQSSFLDVRPGTAESYFAYSMAGVFGGGGGGMSSPEIGVNVDGEPFPVSRRSAVELRLVGEEPVGEGLSMYSTLGPLKALVIRRKSDGKVVSVDVGEK